jgi:uncharacterized protein YggE
VLVALLLGPIGQLTAQANPPGPPEIATSAEGEVNLPPTRALITLNIETRANSAAEASNQAGRKVRAVREAVGRMGFPLDSIRTVSFFVNPTYDMERGQKPVDYRGFAIIQLNVRNLERVAAVMDTALAAGVTQIPDLQFDSDSVPAARKVAIARALERARADAEALAGAAGGRLGKLLSATTSGGNYPMPRAQMEFSMAKGGAPDVTRNVVVNVSVQARWEFLERQ